MSDGFSIDYSSFDRALARVVAQSKRDPIDLMKQQAKLVVKGIIEYTPPASAGVTGSAARMQGEAAVARDLGRIYGGTSPAYQLMKDKETHNGQAKGFYALVKAVEHPRARDLFRAVTGESFQPFDGGALHRSRRNTRGRVGRTRRDIPLMFTWDDDLLKDYTREKKGMVGFLAAGWNQAAAMLGFKPIGWIWRHSAPGSGDVIVNSEGVTVRMINRVEYANSIKDLSRRVQWALDRQAAKLHATADNFVAKLFQRNGFRAAA